MKVFELKVLLFSTWIWTTTFAQIYQRDLSLECRADGHQVLSEQSRKVSSLNSPRVSHETLCDTALYPRWYRFSLDGNNAEIASKCLTANQCGTSTPIWLRAKKNDSVISYDDRPSLPGKHQSKVIIACVAIQSDCCAHSILINVKNCGDFFIYFLWIPPEVKASVKCPAFCAESKVSVAKTTRDSHVKRSPFIKPRVISTDLRVEGAFRLRCIFEDPVGRGRALYRITWTSSKTGNTKVLHTEDTINTYSEADVINTDVNIACAVKVVDRVNPKNILLEESKSENFYVGLKMEPSEINLKEGEKQSVTVTSSVPFICDSNGDDSCSMRVFFKSRNSDRTNNLPTNVMLDECSVAIFREACNEEGCGRGVFEISGVEDFANDGNRRTTIEIRPILNNDVVWTGYNAGSVEVTVTDVPTSQCYSYTDPHILTLDGALYDLHTTGTFVFYRSTERNFEVHARVWDRCDVGNTTTDSTPAWCHCGVAVQENGDVIVIDRCERDTSSTYDVTEPDIEIISELPLAQGTTILKSHNGKKITVFFPSGAFVRVDVETWGLGLTIQAPTIDREKTTGLCGNFDGNQENDPNKKEIDKWRLTAGASLFERIPMKKTPSLEINQNQCVCGNQGDECLYSNPVSRPNLFGGNDVTEYYIMLARRKMIAETEKLSQRQSFSENIPSWQNQEVRHPVQKPPGVFYNRSKRSARRGKKNRRLSRRKRRDANGDNTNKRVKRQAFGQYVGNQQPYYHPYYQPSYQPTQNYRQPGAYQSIGNGYQNQWPIAGATNPPAYDSPGGHKSQTKNQNRYSSNSFVPKSATSSQTFGQQPGISVGGYSAEQNPDYGSYAPNFYDPYPNYGQQFNSYNYESNYNQYQNPKYQNFNQKIPELQNQGYGQYSNVGSSYETPYSFSNSQQNQFAPPTKEVATPVRESNTGIPAVSRFSEKEYNYNQHNIYPTQRSRSAQSNNLHDSRYNHQSQSMSNDDVSGVTSRRHPRHERMRESSEVGGMNLHRELSDEPRTFGNTNNYGNVPDMISIYSEQDSRVQDSEYKIHPSYVFTEDLFPKTSLKTAMRWPNKRGWSKKFVTRKCSSTIRHLSIVTACEQTLGEESIQAAIDICVRDVHDKADWVWAERTYSMIENMCEEKLIKDTNLWRRKGDGSLSPPENIQSALRCPHNCYSNGRCRTNGCVCNTGYSGVDCSIKFTEKVVVTTTETTTTSSPTRPTTTSTTDVTTLMTSPRTILSSTTKNYPFVTKRKNHLRGQTDDNSNMTTQSKPTRQATAIKLVRKGRQPEEAIPTMPYRGQAVTLTHAANSGECRLSVSVCDRIELFGTGFNRKNPDSDLRCLVTKVEDGSQLPSLSFPAEIDPDDESHLYCPLPDTESLGMSPPPEVKYLIKLVDGDQESNSLEVVVFMDYGLQNPCIEINEPPHLVKANETLKAFEGEMFVYQLAAEDPFVFFELDDSTPNAYLTLNGLLEWSVPVADPIKEKNISFIIQDQCGLTTKETVQISILPCLCENGGLCLPDLEKESGLGAYECRCPIGFDGKFCNETDGACLPGLTGSDCSQDIDECLQSPCYEGVECFNVIGSFVCGACPDGYIGNGFACAKADRVQGDGVSDVSNLEDENFVSSVEDIHALAHDVQASRELARDLAYDEDNLEYGESYQVDHENNDEIVVPKLESIISKDDKINHENSESHDKVNGAENHESGNITENRGQIEIAKVEVSNLGRGVDQANINDTTHKIPADDVSDINGHDNNHSVNHEVNHEVHEEKVKLNGIESLPPEYENTNSKLEENSDSKMAEVGDPITHEEIYEYGEIEEAPPVEARDPIRSESKVGGVQELPPPEFRDLNNENIVDSNTPGYVTNNEENISSNTSLELVENVDESEEITEFPPPAFRNLVNDNDALLNVTEAPKSHKTIIKSDVILERDPPEYLTKKEINDISFPDVIEVSSNDKGSNGSDSELPPPEVQNSGTNTNSPVPTNTITVPTPITILASTDSDSETKNNVDLVNINRTNQLVVPEIAPILPIAFETDPVTTSTNTKHRTDTSIVTTSDKILSTPRQSTTSRAKTSTPRTESSTSTTPEKKPSASISHSAESGSPTTHRTDSTIPTTTTNKPSTSTIITRSSIPTSPKTDTTTVEKKSPTPRADTSIPTTPITESSTPTSPRTDSTTSPTTPTKKPITPTIPIAKTSILTTHKTESSTPREAITTTTANNTIEPSTTTTTDTMLASSTTKGSTANELENSKSKLWNDFKNLRTRIQSRKSSVAISKPNTTSITRLTELVKLISTRIPSTLPRPEKKLLDATSNATRQTKINVTVPSLLSSNKNSTSISMHRPANTATRSKPESGTTNQPTSARTPTPGTTSLPTTKSTATSSVSNMKPTAIVNFTTIHMKPTDSPKPVPSETKLPVIVPDLVKIDSKTDVNNITSAHPADDTVEHVTVPTTSSTTKSVPTASKTTTSVPATSKTTTFAPETSTATTSVPTTSKTTKFPPITSATTTLVPTTGTTTLPVSTTSTNTTSLSTTIDASTSAPTTRMTTTSAQTTSKTTTSTPTTRPTSVPTTNETTTLVETTSPTTTIYASTTTAFVPTTSTNTTSPTTRTVSTSAPTTKTTTTSLPTTSKTTISESTTETTTTYLPTTTSTIGIATTSVPTTSKTTKPIPTTRPKTTSVPTTKQTTAFVPTNRTTTTSAPTTRPTSAFVPTINTTETSIPTTTTSTTTLPTTESITYTAITDSTTSILTTTTKKAVLTKMRRMMKCRKTKAGKVCVPVFRRMKYKPKLKHHLMIGGRPFEYYISRRYGRTQKYSQKDCQKRCGNKGTCNTNGMCKCKPQYAGQFCERSACDTLCENNGTCISRNTCKCVGGYFGGLCEKFKCENPCQNGGNCVGPNTCDCIKGCTGESCEIPVCEPECGNGGKCETGNKCSCLSGYVGDRCQKATCTPKCQNGGSCISKDVCACSRLHLGNRCQISVCAPRCGHGGRCLKDNKCLCKSGWNGNHCTSPVCIEKCANGGVCVSPNKCKCKSGWSGSTCKTGHCRRCRFGARCVRPNVCKCPFGPRGRICLLRTRHSLRSSASFGRF